MKASLILTSLVFLAVGCGTDESHPKKDIVPPTEVPSTPIPTPTPTPVPTPPKTPEVAPTPPTIKEYFHVRFYYIIEDEKVNKVACTVETRGLEMEYQIKNISKEDYLSLNNKPNCEKSGTNEVSCDITDNFLWIDQTCTTGTTKYRHYYRPNLDFWGPNGMPAPYYAFGGWSQ